jgi:hypothetical protein
MLQLSNVLNLDFERPRKMKGVYKVERMWYYGIFSDQAHFEIEFTDDDFDVEVLVSGAQVRTHADCYIASIVAADQGSVEQQFKKGH